MIASATVFRRVTSTLTAEVGGQVVMLDPATSDYFGLADVGARIWQLCDAPQTVDALVAVLLDEYDVDAATCAIEVKAFVADLESAGLLVVQPSD